MLPVRGLHPPGPAATMPRVACGRPPC